MEYNYASIPTLCLQGTLQSELYFYSKKNLLQITPTDGTVPAFIATIQ